MSKYKGYTYNHDSSDERWKRENTTRMSFRFNKRTDADVIEQINAQESKLGYIKRLIREDIEKSKASAETSK